MTITVERGSEPLKEHHARVRRRYPDRVEFMFLAGGPQRVSHFTVSFDAAEFDHIAALMMEADPHATKGAFLKATQRQ